MDDIFNSIVEGTLTFKVALLVILCSILLGFFVSYIYMLVNKKEGYSTRLLKKLYFLKSFEIETKKITAIFDYKQT